MIQKVACWNLRTTLSKYNVIDFFFRSLYSKIVLTKSSIIKQSDFLFQYNFLRFSFVNLLNLAASVRLWSRSKIYDFLPPVQQICINNNNNCWIIISMSVFQNIYKSIYLFQHNFLSFSFFNLFNLTASVRLWSRSKLYPFFPLVQQMCN